MAKQPKWIRLGLNKTIGIGYRAARANSVGNYFGAAYYHNMDAEESDSSGRVALFMEKDNSRRFGRLGLSRATSDATGTEIGGTHVWFLQSGLTLGLGFDRSYETGDTTDTFDTALKYTKSTAGLLLMFRM
jgi:hypothetical protein